VAPTDNLAKHGRCAFKLPVLLLGFNKTLFAYIFFFFTLHVVVRWNRDNFFFARRLFANSQYDKRGLSEDRVPLRFREREDDAIFFKPEVCFVTANRPPGVKIVASQAS
jgi:uncharacterized membrane protein YobD (UPF0266 family)